jgi:hypothetical protein
MTALYPRFLCCFSAGARPFMITGAFSRWNISAATFSLSYFESAHRASVADFYPHNMPRSSAKPYLVPMRDALREMRQRTHAFPRDMYVRERTGWMDGVSRAPWE